MQKPRCYLAGQVSGILYKEVKDRRAWLTRVLEAAGVEVVDPLADETPVLQDGYCIGVCHKDGKTVDTEEMARMDMRQVASCCFLFADFDLAPQIVSRGGLIELGGAYMGGLRIYSWIARDSVYDYPFVKGVSNGWSYHLPEVVKMIEEEVYALHS